MGVISTFLDVITNSAISELVAEALLTGAAIRSGGVCAVRIRVTVIRLLTFVHIGSRHRRKDAITAAYRTHKDTTIACVARLGHIGTRRARDATFC